MYKFLIKNKIQIIRFIFAGLLASFINYLVYFILIIFFKKIFFASFFGYLTGILFSFIFSKLWVFRDSSKKKIIKSFSIFCLIYFFGGLEMSLVIYFMNKLINNLTISWFLGAFIAALNNFIGTKFILFKK